jgi:hypothetical protein
MPEVDVLDAGVTGVGVPAVAETGVVPPDTIGTRLTTPTTTLLGTALLATALLATALLAAAVPLPELSSDELHPATGTIRTMDATTERRALFIGRDLQQYKLP